MSFRSTYTSLIALVFIAALIALPASAAAKTASTQRLIIGFKPSASNTRAQASALKSAGISARSVKQATKRPIQDLSAVVVNVPKSKLLATQKKLAKRSDIAYVEIDHTVRAYSEAPDLTDPFTEWDPFDEYKDVEEADELDQDQPAAPASNSDPLRYSQWSLDAIGAPAAWAHSRGAGITVAVLDTGVDYGHPDLRGAVKLGPDYVTGDGDPMDEQGHGTHVAGTIAARQGNNIGIAGVAPEATILAVRVLDRRGEGSQSDVARGIIAATKAGAKVINLSLGGDETSALMESALNFATAHGAIVTCASGNESSKSIGYPARYDSCLAVGAVTETGALASFSNTGTGMNFVAPGSGIVSTEPNGTYQSQDGTSMAAPHVAAVAALVRAQGHSRRSTLSILNSTAVDLGKAGKDTTFGVGRINAQAAVEQASRTVRSNTAGSAPRVSKVAALKTRKKSTAKLAQKWVVQKRTAWKKVGYTREPGVHAWKETTTQGKRRTIQEYRASSGDVFRRTVSSVRKQVKTRKSTSFMRFKVSASGPVDRVSLDIDGRTRAVKWSASGGWVFELPCSAGTKSVIARAFDAADRSAQTSRRIRVKC